MIAIDAIYTTDVALNIQTAQIKPDRLGPNTFCAPTNIELRYIMLFTSFKNLPFIEKNMSITVVIMIYFLLTLTAQRQTLVSKRRYVIDQFLAD